ncbi:hypothetical protein [Chishuiella sp.]|uniref:hypothetical protein n=1 Tax=Chishuiella sp. TaxID=1969467 RepID=UPI0028A99BAE|nr:hypothetical protein [Chishuiella sp.]
MHNINLLRKELLNNQFFNESILELINNEKWLQIWVPKEYGGLGLNFNEGLKKLLKIAQIDGSLGWFVTLCSGANYFSRNLKPSIAKELFYNKKTCFGGSGMLGGTAEVNGDYYTINGLWHYATGAPYLTHYTLNAKITKQGKEIIDEDGNNVFLSFILDKSQVTPISTWKSMGMVATASHSFEVNNQKINKDYSFIYNNFYSKDLIEKVPFSIFADLTLLVNYIGMANHFLEKSLEIINYQVQIKLKKLIENSTFQIDKYASIIENKLLNNRKISKELENEIHTFGEITVETITKYIIDIYPHLGIKASKINDEINQIFRDYFTATQHKNFRKTI